MTVALTVTGDDRDIAIVRASMIALLGELEDQENRLIELRDAGDGSLASQAAPGRLQELGRLQAHVANLWLDLPEPPQDRWPSELIDLQA